MPTRITLTLSDRDLEFFRDAVRRARDAVRVADEDEIIEAIREVVDSIRNTEPLPEFITDRMPELQRLIDMLGDADWELPAREREQLLATFIYFCDPEDLIPDDLPGIGFLDDVIILELLLREMHHVADAYADFVDYRARLGQDAGERSNKLGQRRQALQERMRRRHAADIGRGYRPLLW